MAYDTVIEKAIAEEWEFLAAPGTWFSGAERVAIAAEARRAMLSEAPGDELKPELAEVVRMVAATSPLISAAWVAELPDRGVELPAYAEIIGIVARLSAVDFSDRARGLPVRPLPGPEPGDASATPPPADLVMGKSYLPMVDHISIPQTISIVPRETVAWQALSDAMYMTFAEMDDSDFRRVLHRTQIELVAARTSQVNECFY